MFVSLLLLDLTRLESLLLDVLKLFLLVLIRFRSAVVIILPLQWRTGMSDPLSSVHI